MNIAETLDEIKQKIKKDPHLCTAFLKTRQGPTPLSAFCQECRSLGYEIYEMDIIDAGEEFYAAIKRSTNGGGENSPVLKGEDDFYEMFFADLECWKRKENQENEKGSQRKECDLPMKQWTQAAIIGMGALGMMYGERIGEKLGGEGVCFVADPERARRYRQMDFTVNGVSRQFSIRDPKEMEPVDLVIVAVKGTGLSEALDVMESCVGPKTTIISVLNGISSEEIIGERFGEEKVIHCIAQGMDAVKFGGDLNYSKFGELRIGILKKEESGPQKSEQQKRLTALEHFLCQTGIPYVEEADIWYRMWGKFMLNVGVNQTCMAYETNYGGALAPGDAYQTMVGAMEEVISLANSEGVALTQKDLEEYIELLKTLSPEGMPSMRQDGIAHRPTEVELFSGTVRRLAEKHGQKVPVNDWLYEKIRGMERAWRSV